MKKFYILFFKHIVYYENNLTDQVDILSIDYAYSIKIT